MKQFFRILFEGAAQAWQQLLANKLRSFLSLLGVTIGIFCIIGVKSAVNSLEDNIRGSMAKLALNTGAENVVNLYASLPQLTMIQMMTIGHSDHAQNVAANYMVQTQVCCGVSDESYC